MLCLLWVTLDIFLFFCDIALRWVPQDLIDYVQTMVAAKHQAIANVDHVLWYHMASTGAN